MKKLLKLIGKTITVLLTTLLSVVVFTFIIAGSTLDTSLDTKLLEKVYDKIDLELEASTLIKKESANKLIKNLTQIAIKDGKLIPTVIGLQRNNRNLHLTTEVGILIDSSGGSVDLLKLIVNNFYELKSLNIRFTCYIANAKSSAFTFVQTICDDRILLKNGELMQHEVYFPTKFKGKYKNTSTKVLSMNMAKVEADRIGMKLSEWYKISREYGNKFFTEEEAKKYKLIDSVLE